MVKLYNTNHIDFVTKDSSIQGAGGEMGTDIAIDAGGVSREFYTKIREEIIKTLLVKADEYYMLSPNITLDQAEFLGVYLVKLLRSRNELVPGFKFHPLILSLLQMADNQEFCKMDNIGDDVNLFSQMGMNMDQIMNLMKKTAFIVLLFLAFISCKESPEIAQVDASKRGLITEKAMVISARKEASQIGAEILEKGGNVFDAMMATDLALSVAYPYAGSIGGGGFMVYRLADGEIGALDFREKAPLASSRDMYLDEEGNVIPDMSTLGAMAVGVPGGIAGIFEAHKKFGKLLAEKKAQFLEAGGNTIDFKFNSLMYYLLHIQMLFCYFKRKGNSMCCCQRKTF